MNGGGKDLSELSIKTQALASSEITDDQTQGDQQQQRLQAEQEQSAQAKQQAGDAKGGGQ